MSSIILDISKYLIIFFFVLFTLAVYYGAVIDNKSKGRWAERIQLFCVFAVQFTGNLVLALYTSDAKLLAFYFVQLLFLLAYHTSFTRFYEGISITLLNIVCMLFIVGIIIVARLNTGLVYRHFFMIFISAIVSLIVPGLVRFFSNENGVSVICAIAGIIGLVLVLILADVERGAKLAITIGDFSFQISEFVKISFVIMCAGFFKDRAKKGNFAACTVFTVLHIIILVLSKDLGAALIIGLTYLLMLFISLYNYGVLILGAAGIAASGFLAYHFFAHVQVRVDVWLDPWKDVLGDGWQVLQSLFAIGTGGWLGSGLFNGSPNSIPIVMKDFIFSAISEEMGGIVAVCIILIYLAFIIKLMFIAIGHKSEYAKLIIAGFACIIAVQIILNIGGVIKFIPSTGVTLPLISYGGSSMMSIFIIYGLIQGYSIIKPKESSPAEK